MPPFESLEPRRLFASVATFLSEPDGTLVITGTRRADQVSVVEHFPGSGIYDVFVNDMPFRQFGALSDVWIDAGGGNDVVTLGGGPIPISVTAYGGSGNDQLTGAAGHDTLHGGPGRDTLDGAGGNDLLLGDAGNDTLTGAAGNDQLDGGAGRDILTGADGEDALNGGAGRDTLDAGDGNDDLIGGNATDLVTGGPGADEFSATDTDSEITDLATEDSRNTLP